MHQWHSSLIFYIVTPTECTFSHETLHIHYCAIILQSRVLSLVLNNEWACAKTFNPYISFLQQPVLQRFMSSFVSSWK